MMAEKCLLIPILVSIILTLDVVHGVIMPPRVQSRRDIETNLTLNLQDYPPDPPEPYLLTINEAPSIEITIDTISTLTIDLNRAIPEDISVFIQVFSGTDLIEFISGNQTLKNYTVKYQANTFGDRAVSFRTGKNAGHAEIVCKILRQPNNITIDDSSSYISINIGKDWQLGILINIVGWIYFSAWSLSFYFQVILNYKRKSVVGLNFDFMALNLLGFTFYSIYNISFLFSRQVQKDYYERHQYSRIPVEYNDLFFAVHAFVLTLITVIQCFIYERGEQKVSISTSIFVGLTSILAPVLYILQQFALLKTLDVVLYLSYVKLAITLIKYTPQAYMNYKRKTTSGWSIHNILLDFTGGLFSVTQMFLLAHNYNDWISIFGNFTKFGLGVISILFDILFVVQHYILYKQVGHLEVSTDSVPSPVISETVRSTSYRQPGDTMDNVSNNNDDLNETNDPRK